MILYIIVFLCSTSTSAMFTTGPLMDLSRGSIEADDNNFVVPEEDTSPCEEREIYHHAHFELEIPVTTLLSAVPAKKMVRYYGLFLLPSTSLPSVLSVSRRLVRPFVQDQSISLGSRQINLAHALDIADNTIRVGYAALTIMHEYRHCSDTKKFLKETALTLAKKPVSAMAYRGLIRHLGGTWYPQLLGWGAPMQPAIEYLAEKHVKFPFEYSLELTKKLLIHKKSP